MPCQMKCIIPVTMFHSRSTKMTKNMKIRKIIYSLSLSILTISCTIVNKRPVDDVKFAKSDKKLKIPIYLVVTDNIKEAKWESRRGIGQSYSFQVGEDLAHNIEVFLGNVFEDVTVKNNTKFDSPLSNTNYLMIPKLKAFEQTWVPMFLSVTKTSITMEWRIVDGSGKLIWIETLTGSYDGNSEGKSTEEREKKYYNQALIDLFQKSQKEMFSSKLLRSLQSKELQTVNSKQSILAADIKNGNHSEMSAPVLQPTPDQKKIAILPFHINQRAVKYGGPVEEPTVKAICQALKVNKNLFPIYSYYDIRDEFETELIDQNLISVNDSKKLWFKKSFSLKIPNIDLSCEIGKKMGADLVLLVSIVSANQYTYDVDYYLINIKDHSVFKRSDQIHTSRFKSDILSVTKLYFDAYVK